MLVAQFVGDFLAEGRLSLKPLGQAILDVEPIEEEGDPPLVDADLATGVVYAIMARLKEAKGEEAAAAAWAESGLALSSFVCSLSPEKEDAAALKADAEKQGLGFLAPA